MEVSKISYSLLVQDGDLVRRGSSLAIVSGVDKLKQDLQLWVSERFGGDRFHPAMGSILQDMIGDVITASTRYRVGNEVARVLDNYQRVQFRALKEKPQVFSTTELLYSIDDIQVRLTYDTVTVVVKVRTAASGLATLTFTQGL